MLAEKNITIPPFRPYFLFPIMSNEELEKGAIVSVSEGQIRIRMLPISEE